MHLSYKTSCYLKQTLSLAVSHSNDCQTTENEKAVRALSECKILTGGSWGGKSQGTEGQRPPPPPATPLASHEEVVLVTTRVLGASRAEFLFIAERWRIEVFSPSRYQIKSNQIYLLK